MGKPHKGKIVGWCKSPCRSGLGFLICGTFTDHPAREYGHTSYVVSHDEATGEIETRNSRYTLVGDEHEPE